MVLTANILRNQYEAEKRSKKKRATGGKQVVERDVHKPPKPFKQMKSWQEYENYLASTGVF